MVPTQVATIIIANGSSRLTPGISRSTDAFKALSDNKDPVCIRRRMNGIHSKEGLR